jgi:hypothetical protein
MPVFSFEDVTNAVSASYEQSSIVAFTQHMPATAETFAAASPAAQRSSPPRSPPPQPVPRGSPARIVGGSRGGSRGGRPARGPGSRGGRIRAPRAGRVSSRGGRAAVVSTRGGRAGSRGRGGFAFPGDVLDTSFVGTDFPAAVDADNDPDDYYDIAETYDSDPAVPPDWGIQPDAFIQGDYLVTYSFYIGKPNADAPDEWWEPLKAFLAQWSPRFLVAREKGEKKGLIHYQGVADYLFIPTRLSGTHSDFGSSDQLAPTTPAHPRWGSSQPSPTSPSCSFPGTASRTRVRATTPTTPPA